MKDQNQLKQRYKLPSFPFIPLAAKLVKMRAGFNIEEVSPIKVVSNTDTPILFIHGEDDDYVPTYMGKELFDAKNDKKELYIAPKAKHAEALVKNIKQYEKVVSDFLDKYYNH